MELRKKLILRALTDPKFRKMLEENPEQALSSEELEALRGGLGGVLNATEQIDVIAQIIEPSLFCMVHDIPPF